jgi:hypothetical protein
MSEVELPDGFRFAPSYPFPPSPDNERIVAAIRASRPEDIPGLVWTPPDFAARGHKIIRKFDIDRKKRPDGALIPCCMCSRDHPKYLAGAVLWSPDGYLRLIGHVCAAKEEHFGEARYRQLVRQREQEELDNATLAWMETNVAALKPVAASLAELRAPIDFWEEQQRRFFREVAPLAERLERIARREGGMLTIAQESSAARLVTAAGGGGRTAASQYETVAIGMLSGSSFLHRPGTKRSRQLEGILEAFAYIPDGNREEQLMALFDGGEHAVTTATGLAFRNMQRAATLAEECAAARQFFTPDNIALLESWGDDDRNPEPFTIRRYASSVEFLLPDRSRANLQMTWPKLPDLSALHEIVAAGIELDGVLKRHKL